MQKKLQLGKYYLYLADHKMKAASGAKRNKAERHLKHLQTAKLIAEKGIYSCELCGDAEKKLQLHHLYAVSEFPEMELEQNNTILVCEGCHQRIHNNPFLWIDLINQRLPKAAPETKILQAYAQPPYESEAIELLKFDF